MKKNSVTKIILIIFITLILLFSTNVFAATEDTIQNLNYTEEYEEWLKLSDEEKSNTIMPRKYIVDEDNDVKNTIQKESLKSAMFSTNMFATSYERYDLREEITITVKNQEQTGQCWAFCANSMLESNIEKLTGNDSSIYSPRYIEYATAKTFTDGINKKSYNREVGGGGFAEIAMGLYTSGRGPILNEDFPFENNEQRISLQKINNFENKKPEKQIKDYVRFPGIYKDYNSNGSVVYKNAKKEIYTDREVNEIRNKIKQHIVNYGAVVSQTYGVGGASKNAKKYYNNPSDIMNSTAYFCNNTSLVADHQITIIGWDDTYDITNFNPNCRPKTPGAYIVLNSWGTNFGENGVYYVSYEDFFIEKDVLGIVLTTDVNYDNIYQYDELGNNFAAYAPRDIYGANVFNRTNSENNEWLNQVSISTLVDTSCDIYVNPTSGELNPDKFVKVASNIQVKDGYHTVDLEKPVKLTGDKFAVIVKYIANNNGKAYFGLEYPDNLYWKTATAETGQSYISFDSRNWDDIVELASANSNFSIPAKSNLCIKAFTEYKEAEPDFFSIINYKTDDNNCVYGISPQTKVSEFSNNISTNKEYYIYNKNNEIVTNDDQLISTGMTIKNNVNGITYKIFVLGDINGDGLVNTLDVVKTNLHVARLKLLEDELIRAADVNNDGKITPPDVIIMNLVSAKLRNL